MSSESLQHFVHRHRYCQDEFCRVAVCDSKKLIDLLLVAPPEKRDAVVGGAMRIKNERTIRLLRDTLKTALAHVSELREAWERGVISENDGKGGTRSNRNADVEFSIASAIMETGRQPGELVCDQQVTR